MTEDQFKLALKEAFEAGDNLGYLTGRYGDSELEYKNFEEWFNIKSCLADKLKTTYNNKMKNSYIYAFGLRFPIWEGGNSVNIYGDICWIFNDNGISYTYYKNEKIILNKNK